jgi:hypothetical protein
MRLTCISGKQGDFAISTRAWYMFYTIQEIWILRDNSDKFRFEIVRIMNDTCQDTWWNMEFMWVSAICTWKTSVYK